ncbi:MAG: sulfurtransferase TusA family protein [Candidatus Hodarchaeales archaeon]
MSELNQSIEKSESNTKVDITGLKCPVPLILLRKTVIKANTGDMIEFTGTSEEAISRKEILMAIENLKQELVVNEDIASSNRWRILIKKK